MSLKEKEELYLKAKEVYYNTGDEIMNDYEYDMLEEELRQAGSKVIQIVGTRTLDKSNKVSHVFPMLSLAKTNVYDEDIADAIESLNDISRFMSKGSIGNHQAFTATPKFDGCAMELVYEKGILTKCLTRGNGVEGFDEIGKVKHIVPKRLPEKFSDRNIEVRGEIIIIKDAFDKKWSDKFKNARNFVSGILKREEYDPNIWEDFVFSAFFMREYESKDNWNYAEDTLKDLHDMGFNRKYPVFYKTFKTIGEFKQVYRDFKNYRENESPFLLDGMVLTYPESRRIALGENDHDPEWAFAVKFPPVAVITEIIDIDWKTGTSGEVIPTAVMKPVDLDGSTVKRAALHNAGHVSKTKTWPGAKVEIYKAGDIIPQIKRVVRPSVTVGSLPTHCNSCGSELEVDDIHLWCRNDECYAQVISKIEAGKNAFGIENLGKSAIEKIYKAGIKTFPEYFDREKFNKMTLIRSGQFVAGRALDIIVNAVEEVKSVTLKNVILAMKLPDTGRSVSEAVAKYLVGIDVDFGGLNKEAVKKFTTQGTVERAKLNDFLKILNKNGIKVVKPSVDSNDDLPTYVMTGKPPNIKGLKQKSDYSKIFASKGFKEVSKLDASVSYLLTDKLESTSGKMKKAAQLQSKGSTIKVVTYEDFYTEHIGPISNKPQSSLF